MNQDVENSEDGKAVGLLIVVSFVLFMMFGSLFYTCDVIDDTTKCKLGLRDFEKSNNIDSFLNNSNSDMNLPLISQTRGV